MSSENPLKGIFQAVGNISQCIQTHLSQFIIQPTHPTPTNQKTLLSLSNSSKVQISSSLGDKVKSAGSVTKEDLGRATWTFLHTLAAQYPENPTRQQKKDVKELMSILSRMYPCKECADHFKEVLSIGETIYAILKLYHFIFGSRNSMAYVDEVLFLCSRGAKRTNPVEVGSWAAFSQWLCRVHNVVNRSLGKLAFPCERVDARWGKLDCEQPRACDLQGSTVDIVPRKS